MGERVEHGKKLVAVLAAALLTLTPLSAGSASDTARQFARGIAGVVPPDENDRARLYFDRPEVRTVLAAIEEGPVEAVRIEALLADTDTQLEDLLRLKLIRETEAGYAIGFAYFTLADVRQIHASAERHVPALVDAYADAQAELDAALARYPVPSVDRRELGYVLLAGIALNWDALRETRALGYREPLSVEGPGWRYSFWAAERDPDYSTRGFFWGSTSIFNDGAINFAERPVDFDFASFGDPYSDPRMNFPDILYLGAGALRPDVGAAVERLGFVDESFAGIDFQQILGISRARSIGSILFALREGPADSRTLASAVEPEDSARIEDLLHLLDTTGYIARETDGRYVLQSVVLDHADRDMVDDVLAIHNRILGEWLEARYGQIRSELSTLTAIRQGLPFEALFTQIWHDFFGLTTRQMVARRLIADPYADGAASPGSVGMTWRRTVYDREAE